MSEQIGDSNRLDRREFLKLLGVGLAGGAIALLGNYFIERTSTETPRPTATETPTPTPTETVVEIEPSSNIIIEGAPKTVNRTDLRKWANESQPAPGDVRHNNTIGLNTEGWLAEPGVLTANSKEDCGDNPSCWELTPDRQQKLTTPSSVWPLNEEGFAMFSGEAMTLEFGDIKIQVPEAENNGWIVIVRGLPRDYQKGTDNNLPIVVSGYDPGFTTATMLPSGQFVSENYFSQNATAVQGEYGLRRDPSGCGADGCRRVSALFVDAQTGAYTVIQRNNPSGNWELLGTNIQ